MTSSSCVAHCQECRRSTPQTETEQERGGQIWVERRCNDCGHMTARRREPLRPLASEEKLAGLDVVLKVFGVSPEQFSRTLLVWGPPNDSK